jgi:hypothetical protein
MSQLDPVRNRWLASLLCLLWAGSSLAAREFDLKPYWDDRTPLPNPHKGWYHHYPDNHINKYRIAKDSDLLEFPGMDHLYIRLAWAYLQPEENRFNWAIIDDLISKWTAHGLGISFRISCKETSTDIPEQQFATPRWVMQAGAKGGYYRGGKKAGPDAPWEPVFDDPVFLEKLEKFLKEFASRYDGQPWLRYVDIGSVGDWGEGHTWAGSQKPYGFDALKTHIDLHLKYFKKSQLVVSDDFVYGLSDLEARKRLHNYVIEHGISYRDDSILVDGYFRGNSSTFTVRSPEFFADAYARFPTVLELEHYGAVKRAGNWDARPGSSIARYGGGENGANFLRKALGLLHATYIGYHGYAAEWLSDNPRLTGELLNRCGYWYFLHRVEVPDVLHPGQAHGWKLTWENRGVAPAYKPFQLLVRLEGPDTLDLPPCESRNRDWLPSPERNTYTANHVITIPQRFKPGVYLLKLKMRSAEAGRNVLLALKKELMDKEGFYRIGNVTVE